MLVGRQVIPDGQPWQRHVLLRGGGITVERYLSRRMLRPGRCHFCCRCRAGPCFRMGQGSSSVNRVLRSRCGGPALPILRPYKLYSAPAWPVLPPRKAPDPACCHPEPAFGDLELCRGCYDGLEPDTWRR